MKLDILVIVAHPDDAELGCGGTIIKHTDLGYKVGIIDLTEGELGTRGDVQTRYQEAARAGEIMGIHVRENLKFRDGWFTDDEKHKRSIITKIRQYQPEIIITNAPEDRHPDHGRAGKLVADSAWLSGLKKIATHGQDNLPQESWRPKHVYQLIQYKPLKPDLVVDIKGYFDRKMEAVMAYSSQFYNPDDSQPDTLISKPEFLELVRARVLEMGSYGLVDYAEGFISSFTPAVDNLFQLR